MARFFVYSLPMSVFWMIFANQFSVEGFVIGYIAGFAVLYLLHINTPDPREQQRFYLHKLPFQALWLLYYTLKMGWDVLISGLDVARRILWPRLLIDPYIHRIETGDNTNNSIISALSAHSITITPGEMVVDYETSEDGRTVMLVHSLDRNSSTPEKLQRDQDDRLKLIKRIIGDD